MFGNIDRRSQRPHPVYVSNQVLGAARMHVHQGYACHTTRPLLWL